MRATRAYIASAGTAAVMLGASLAVLALVSAFVAFGSWPGQGSGSKVDQFLLKDVVSANPKTVAVRRDAAKVARHSQSRRQVARARTQRSTRTGGGTHNRTGGAKTPSRSIAPSPVAGTPVAAAPGGSAPVSTVRQQTQNVTQNLDTTTRNVTDPVQNQVQQTQTQVNQVVDQVVGTVQQQTGTTVQQVQDTAGQTTDTVKKTASGLLGP